MKSGIKKWEFRKKEFSVSEKKIISGNMVPVPVVRVQRYTMTGVKNMDAENRTVPWVVTVTGIWKSGIMYLPSLKMTETAIMKN